MKSILIILIVLFALFSVVGASDITDEHFNYRQFKPYWEYDMNYKLIILMPEGFKLAVDYYFVKDPPEERTKVAAFTTWHTINGKITPVTFVQARVNLAPTNDDLGHEDKHIVNWLHRQATGVNRFLLPCHDWK